MVEICIKLFVKDLGLFFILRPFTTRHGIELSDFLRYFRAVQNFFD